MANPPKKPNYTKGDRVVHRNHIPLTTSSQSFKKDKKTYKVRRGILMSNGYTDKKICRDKGGKRHFVYDVLWDGNTHTDPIRQNQLKWEKDYNQNDSTVKTNG